MNSVIRQILDNINLLSKQLENRSGPPSETPSAQLSAPALVTQQGPAAPSSSAVEEEVAISFCGTPRMTNSNSASSSAPRFRLGIILPKHWVLHQGRGFTCWSRRGQSASPRKPCLAYGKQPHHFRCGILQGLEYVGPTNLSKGFVSA